MDLTVAQEPARGAQVRELLDEFEAYMTQHAPGEAIAGLTPDELADITSTVFVARDAEGAPMGLGAMKRHGPVGEIKAVYARPEARGQGAGRALLEAIVHQAQAEGLSHMVLRTGRHHPEAWRLFERGRFQRCGPVLDYPEDGRSIFYERTL
jgi:putative acetyltransferase